MPVPVHALSSFMMFSASNAHACILPAATLPTAQREWNDTWSFRHQSNLASPTYLFSVFSDEISTAKNGRVRHSWYSMHLRQRGNACAPYVDSAGRVKRQARRTCYRKIVVVSTLSSRRTPLERSQAGMAATSFPDRPPHESRPHSCAAQRVVQCHAALFDRIASAFAQSEPPARPRPHRQGYNPYTKLFASPPWSITLPTSTVCAMHPTITSVRCHPNSSRKYQATSRLSCCQNSSKAGSLSARPR